MAPKHLQTGHKNVTIAAYVSAGILNAGYPALLYMMELLQMPIGQQYKMFADQVEETRLREADERRSNNTKEARMARKSGENEFFEESEGILYGPGLAD